MSGSFKISASIGSTIIDEDVLFTSSHPGLSTTDTSWTKNPMYAPISSVPLKAGRLNQFQKNARAVSGENESLADVEALQDEFKRTKERLSKLDIVNNEMKEFVSQSRKVHE
jgi:hypothetical protein